MSKQVGIIQFISVPILQRIDKYISNMNYDNALRIIIPLCHQSVINKFYYLSYLFQVKDACTSVYLLVLTEGYRDRV